MEFGLRKNWRGDTALRASFNALVREVFGFDFENWHRNGFWTDSYIPYSFVKHNLYLSYRELFHLFL